MQCPESGTHGAKYAFHRVKWHVLVGGHSNFVWLNSECQTNITNMRPRMEMAGGHGFQNHVLVLSGAEGCQNQSGLNTMLSGMAIRSA